MLFLYILFSLVPLLCPTLAIPNHVSSIFKRDDCHGSSLCQSKDTSSNALDNYNTSANANTYYYDYTSYTGDTYTAIYVCPSGKYPVNVTGADIHKAGLAVQDNCGASRCGSHWMYDSDNQLKCRITLNYCFDCKDVVNGQKGHGSGSLTPITTLAPAPTGSGDTILGLHSGIPDPLVAAVKAPPSMLEPSTQHLAAGAGALSKSRRDSVPADANPIPPVHPVPEPPPQPRPMQNWKPAGGPNEPDPQPAVHPVPGDEAYPPIPKPPTQPPVAAVEAASQPRPMPNWKPAGGPNEPDPKPPIRPVPEDEGEYPLPDPAPAADAPSEPKPNERAVPPGGWAFAEPKPPTELPAAYEAPPSMPVPLDLHLPNEGPDPMVKPGMRPAAEAPPSKPKPGPKST